MRNPRRGCFVRVSKLNGRAAALVTLATQRKLSVCCRTDFRAEHGQKRWQRARASAEVFFA
jgi:hypothetical protein